MSACRVRLTAPALEIAPDEPDQVLRLSRFREKHPGVIIGDGGFGTSCCTRLLHDPVRPGFELIFLMRPFSAKIIEIPSRGRP